MVSFFTFFTFLMHNPFKYHKKIVPLQPNTRRHLSDMAVKERAIFGEIVSCDALFLVADESKGLCWSSAET